MKMLRSFLTALALVLCVQIGPAYAEKVIVDLDKVSPATAEEIRRAAAAKDGAVIMNPGVASHAVRQQGWVDWFKNLDSGVQLLIIFGVIVFVGIVGVWGIVILGTIVT